MWIRSPVLEKLPTLTKTGVQRWISQEVAYPSDIECWFDMVEKMDIDGLKLMVNKGFSIHTKNIHGENMGVIACEKQRLSVLRFYLEHGGCIFDAHDNEISIWERLCWYKYSLFYFKTALNQPIDKLIDPKALNLLLITDKNFSKIKYWCKHYSHYGIQEILRTHMEQMNPQAFEKTPKIYYYLSGKTQLFVELNKNLRFQQNHSILRKI